MSEQCFFCVAKEAEIEKLQAHVAGLLKELEELKYAKKITSAE